MRLAGLIILICLAIIPVLNAGVGNSGSPFLYINAGARPNAMGGAFVAISDDINAIQYNPAGLSQLTSGEVCFIHNAWIDGVNNDFAALAQPVGKLFTVAFAYNIWSIIGLTDRDISGNPVGTDFSVNNTVTAFALGMELFNNISLGFGYKIVQESIGTETADATTFDAGILYKYKRLRFGAALQNMGGEIRLYEEAFPLPSNIKAGVSLWVSGEMLVSLEQNMPSDNGSYTNIGLEWNYSDINSMRIGYKVSEDENTLPGLTFGLGYAFGKYYLNYSFQPFGDLGDTHRFSLNIKFGVDNNTAEDSIPVDLP